MSQDTADVANTLLQFKQGPDDISTDARARTPSKSKKGQNALTPGSQPVAAPRRRVVMVKKPHAKPGCVRRSKKGQTKETHLSGNRKSAQKQLPNRPESSAARIAPTTSRLYVACKSGQTEVVETLITHGADVNQAMKDGDTPLFCALQHGHLEMVKLLIIKGANISQALFFAIKFGHLEIVKLFLQEGANINQALSYAIKFGHLEIVKILLQEGANINQALSYAMRYEQSEIVKLLLKKDASTEQALNSSTPNGVSKDQSESLPAGSTAKEAKRWEQGHSKYKYKKMSTRTSHLVELPPETSAESDKVVELYSEEVESLPLCQASIDGKIELVRDLLIRGHDVNQGDLADRCTPLMRASQKGHTEVVQLLLENQANVNQSNRFGSAPLHMASEKGYTDVVRRLVNANGVDVNQSDHHGLTPLLMASDKGHTEVVRLLVNAYGVDVNKSNKNAATPLLIAIKKGYTEIVRLLVHAQALLDQPDKKGNTPFSVAFDNRHGEVVNLLLEKDPTLLNQVCVTQEQIDNAAGRAEKHVLKRRRQYYRGIEDNIESGSGIESDSESGPGSTDTESNSESGPSSTEVEKDGKSQPAEANSDVVVNGSSYPKTDSDLESCAGTLVVSDSDSGTLVVSDSGSGTPVVSDTDECTEKSPESVQDRITGVEEDLVEEDSSDGKPQRIQSHERTDKSPDSVQDSRVLTDTSSANKQLFPQDVTSSTNHQVRRSSRQHIKFNNRRDIDTYGEKESGQMKAFRWHIYDYSLKKSREMLMGHFSPNTCEALKITLRNIHASPTGEPGHGLLFQQIKLSEKDEEIIFKALPFPCIAYYVFLKHLIAKIPPIEIDEEPYSFDFSTWKCVLKSQTKRPGNIHTYTVDDQESVDNEVYDSLREYGKYSGKPQGTDGLTPFAFPSYSKCICDARKKVFKKLDRSSRLDFCEQQIFGGSLGLDEIYHKGVKEFIRYFELSICLLASEPSFSTATDEE